MAHKRRHMAVVQVQPKRRGIELVDKCLAHFDGQHAVHVGFVDAVKVHGVGMVAAVDEGDAHAVALGGANKRARAAPVVDPGREADARRDLDGFVGGDDGVFAQRLAAG
jgi:hypothetical protein